VQWVSGSVVYDWLALVTCAAAEIRAQCKHLTFKCIG